MKFEAQAFAGKRCRDLIEERAIGVKPRDFILVLVGHQLEQITRDGIRQPVLARRPLRLGGLGLFDPCPIAPCVSRILIIGEKFYSPLNRLGERLWRDARRRS